MATRGGTDGDDERSEGIWMTGRRGSGGVIDRVIDWTLTGDLGRRVLAQTIVGCVLYGATIALDALVLRQFFGDVISENSDLAFYRFRGEYILDGKIPYVDFESESPPLIMYMFVVPQLAGGSTQSYQVFFAFFAILTSLLLYLGFRHHDERKAMMAGLAYLAFPLCLMEFAIGAQDEAVTTFLFLLPLVLMHLGRGWTAGLASLVGVLTKMFNVLLVPWMFLHADRRNRVAILVSFVGLTLLILVPLMILFPDQLPSFRFYFLGNPDNPTGGSSISPWHYLGELGYGLPGWAGMTLALTGLVGATLVAFKWRLTFWQGSVLVMIAFFLFYPKILMAYFIMPIALLMMWGLEDRKTMLRLFAMIVPLFVSMAITGNGTDPVSDQAWVWLLGMAFSLVGWGIMLYTWWEVKDKKVFFERD